MREGVGHAAGGGEALGVDEALHELAGLAFGGLAGGDVFDHPEDRDGVGRMVGGVFGLGAQQGDGELGGKGAAVRPHDLALDAVAVTAAFDEIVVERAVEFALGGQKEVPELVLEEPCHGQLEMVGEALVDEQEVAVGCRVGHAYGGLVEGGGEALLGEA